MEVKDYLSNYYEQYDEDGRLTSRHGMVEVFRKNGRSHEQAN